MLTLNLASFNLSMGKSQALISDINRGAALNLKGAGDMRSLILVLTLLFFKGAKILTFK